MTVIAYLCTIPKGYLSGSFTDVKILKSPQIHKCNYQNILLPKIMAQLNDRFIILPNNINLTREGLHYKDLLTYITIRSFNNDKTDRCNPALNTLVGVSGMTKKFVIASIKRLEAAGYLEVQRSDRAMVSNQYSFTKCHSYSQIPYSIFDAEDLTPNEKGILIALRQFVNSFDLIFLVNHLKDMCDVLDITYKALYTQHRSLIEKGYIVKFKKIYPNSFSVDKVKLSDRLNWLYDHPLRHLPKPEPIDLSSIWPV